MDEPVSYKNDMNVQTYSSVLTRLKYSFVWCKMDADERVVAYKIWKGQHKVPSE